MFRKPRSWQELLGFLFVVPLALLVSPSNARAQGWRWMTEPVDTMGTDTSVVADQEGNLHLSYRYGEGGKLIYAFRPVGDSRWYKMVLEQGSGVFSTKIAVGPDGNPHICYTPRALKYARFDGKKWHVQEIDPGGGLISYTCSVRVSPDGTPHVTWYVESGVFLRYAILKDGVWLARTIDLGGLPGKWNSLALDSTNDPHLAYSQFPQGELKYSVYDGKSWKISVIDSPESSPAGAERGMGASLALDMKGGPLISYYDTQSLKFARLVNGRWSKEIVDQLPPYGAWGWKMFSSTLVLDGKGYPHIGYQSYLGLKHAWWDGSRWHTQSIVPASGVPDFENSMTIDRNDILYIVYRDPVDGTLRLAVGRPSQGEQTAKMENKQEDKDKE